MPNSPLLSDQSLSENLHYAEIIKQNMTELLRRLESNATGKPVKKPGSWRHNAADWATQNPPSK